MVKLTRYSHGRSSCTGTWGSPTVQRTWSGELRSETLARAGSKTPGWQRLRNAGRILPVNPYGLNHTEIEITPGSGSTFLTKSGGCFLVEHYGDMYYPNDVLLLDNPHIPSSGDFQAAVNSAIADSSAGEWAAAVSALEARETLRMLENAARLLIGVVREVRSTLISVNAHLRSNRRATWRGPATGRTYRGSVSFDSVWLELRFGWLPLIQDVNDAIRALNSVYQKGDRKQGHGSRSGGNTVSDETVTPGANSSQFRRSRSTTTTWQVKGFALSLVEFPTAAKYGLSPVALWETARLSFVLDYFWDIGSFLAANSTTAAGYKLVASGYSVKTVTDYMCTTGYEYGLNPAISQGGIVGQIYRKRVTTFSRVSDPGGGLPSVNFRLSAIQLVNLAALLAQAGRAAFR